MSRRNAVTSMTLNLTGELFRARSGAQITSIPYPGDAEAMSDLLSGRVQVIIESLPGLAGLVSDGKLKILAFATPKRLPNFPKIPTIAEVLPDFEAVGWHRVQIGRAHV